MSLALLTSVYCTEELLEDSSLAADIFALASFTAWSARLYSNYHCASFFISICCHSRVPLDMWKPMKPSFMLKGRPVPDFVYASI